MYNNESTVSILQLRKTKSPINQEIMHQNYEFIGILRHCQVFLQTFRKKSNFYLTSFFNKNIFNYFSVHSISYLNGKTWKINNRKKSKNVVFKKDCRCLFKGKKEAILVSKRITKAGKIRGQFFLLPIQDNIRKLKKKLGIKNKKKSFKSKKKRKQKTKRE